MLPTAATSLATTSPPISSAMDSSVHPAPPSPSPALHHHPTIINTLPAAWTFFAPSVILTLTVMVLWDCPFPRISHLPPLRALRRFAALITHVLSRAFDFWERWATMVAYWIAMAPFVAAFIVLTYPVHLLRRTVILLYRFLKGLPYEQAAVDAGLWFVEVVGGALGILRETLRQTWRRI
jgi:hypothetical protein